MIGRNLTLNLTRIRTAQERYEQTYTPEQVADLGDAETFRAVAPAELAFDIYKDKDLFRLIGRVKTTLELPCGRCLEPFTLPVDAEFDLRYQPHAQNTGEGEREVEEDDLTTAFYRDDEIDLGLLMQEQCILALPMKPLCRPDCKGLCPTCGANWNRETCDCDNSWPDPRLAALKAINLEQRTSEHDPQKK